MNLGAERRSSDRPAARLPTPGRSGDRRSGSGKAKLFDLPGECLTADSVPFRAPFRVGRSFDCAG
jgi:hypothetical protein